MHTHFQGISSYFGPWSNLVKPRPKRLHFFPISYKSNLKVDLDAHLRGTHKNVHDGVSLLTNFLELKFDDRFKCAFGK